MGKGRRGGERREREDGEIGSSLHQQPISVYGPMCLALWSVCLYIRSCLI